MLSVWIKLSFVYSAYSKVKEGLVLWSLTHIFYYSILAPLHFRQVYWSLYYYLDNSYPNLYLVQLIFKYIADPRFMYGDDDSPLAKLISDEELHDFIP